jgi:hypothetical protein
LKTDFFRVASSGVATWRMPKRSSKKKDINETAFSIVQQATGQPEPAQAQPEKNPAAVSLGRLGGLKGGKARAKNLSAEQRKEIARKAAESRWRRK